MNFDTYPSVVSQANVDTTLFKVRSWYEDLLHKDTRYLHRGGVQLYGVMIEWHRDGEIKTPFNFKYSEPDMGMDIILPEGTVKCIYELPLVDFTGYWQRFGSNAPSSIV